jgi:hypothetical protein
VPNLLQQIISFVYVFLHAVPGLCACFAAMQNSATGIHAGMKFVIRIMLLMSESIQSILQSNTNNNFVTAICIVEVLGSFCKSTSLVK